MIRAYTDGACSGEPRARWVGVGDRTRRRRDSGGEEMFSTNQRMEITAALEASALRSKAR